MAGCAAATTDGFDIAPPDGWEDRTDAAETKTGVDYQAVFEGPTDGDVTASIIVDDVDPPDDADPGLGNVVAEAREAVQDGFENRGRLGPVAETTLAGEPARRFDAEAGDSRLREVVALRGDRVYTIALLAERRAFERHLPVLDRLLESWRWDPE